MKFPRIGLCLAICAAASSAFAGAAAAQDSRPILTYSYGNQIFGSVLRIFGDGSIEHAERTCCPPRADSLQEPALTSTELAALEGWIAAAAQAGVVRSAGHPTTDGSQSGSLSVFQDGREIVIHAIQRGGGSGENDAVQTNLGDTAARIEALVDRYVKYAMYR